MVTTVLLALGLFVCRGQSQLYGSGIFPGPPGFENGLYGSGPFNFVPLAEPILTTPPLCFQQAPTCSIPAPPCSFQIPPCGIQLPPCSIQVPPCGIQAPPCGIQVPPCGIQIPPCGIQAPPCGIQIPPCGIQAPPCSIQSPIINNIAPTLIPNQLCDQCYSVVPNQQCLQCLPLEQNLATITQPCDVVFDIPLVNGPTTSVIDNTLANSLANALQLLIVSNLLDTLNTPVTNSLASLTPLIEALNPITCGNAYPDNPCNQIVICEPSYETIMAPYSPCCQQPIGSYAPCVEASPCGQVFGPTFSPSFSCDNCGLNPCANSFALDNCGLLNSYANICPNNCGLVNPFANGFGCQDNLYSPLAADVLFPAEIPAQLTCNFGYMPTNVPCVSVNVETLPFDSCSCNKKVFF